MANLKDKRKNAEAKRERMKEKIPKNTMYCYDEKGACPFLKIRKDKNVQQNGMCRFLKKSDYAQNRKRRTDLLWDSVKSCGEGWPKDDEEMYLDYTGP